MNGVKFAPQALFAVSSVGKCDLHYRRCWPLLMSLLVALLCCENLQSQTASTGALTGLTLDPSGAVLRQVSLHLTRLDGTEPKDANSDENGWFGFFLLSPGTYEVQASKSKFRPLGQKNIQVHVTETLRIQLRLQLALDVENTEVFSDPLMVQLDTSAMGRAANKEAVSGLPLVTRNFTQIAGLSPGVVRQVHGVPGARYAARLDPSPAAPSHEQRRYPYRHLGTSDPPRAVRGGRSGRMARR